MAWFVRFTRFGDAHLVYAQEKGCSCGIACVMMTVFKVNKLTPGVRALHSEKEIYKVYSRVSHTHYEGNAYSYANFLASTLNRLRVGKWKAEDVGNYHVAKRIVGSVGESSIGPVVSYSKKHSPIIVLVGWKKGGAHFVVIDSVVSFMGGLYASVCDPWDGDVHITPVHLGKHFTYVGAEVPWSWDIGGTRHDYSTKKSGGGNGWVVRRVG